ncbi:MAG: RidA family protein [Cellvibrionales bacterium]|jgi:reactive intermediate/imine deaminase|nr:RidA family protein [Cellvibrionales bacterium]MBK8674932.1 RidA family protein [Cellvibrionales bacterium]TXH52264.1 MAG: RidA family protein [Cellvibrionales bacterium]HRF87306.1 RidA family protein [Pseudomonadales bacterium]HRG49436.1 RidA family protein [Pseudomonadales bacterium]
MTNKAVIQTEKAPAAIGTYSQAIKVNNTVYLSGQIPLDPVSMQMVDGDMRAQITQVFENLSAVCEAAGGSLKDIVKLNIFLTDLAHFALVNEVMAQYFVQPYPARAAVGVASLPRAAQVEMDGVMVI